MILIVSLPTSWMVVGCVLIVVTLIAVVLKAREVGALKKEVEELRDTMRMMRYEEANLSRMLHTADKHPELMEQDEETGEETGEDTDEENTGTTEIAEEATENPEAPEGTESSEKAEETESSEATESPEEAEEAEWRSGR